MSSYTIISAKFTASGLLLQSVFCLRMIPTEHLTTPPHGKEGGQPTHMALSHLSPERILDSNSYRLFKFWDYTSEKRYCVMVAQHEVLHWFAQLLWQHSNFYHRDINLMQAKNHSNKVYRAEEWQFKNILNSMSDIHCDCKYFYKSVTLNVLRQIHY